MCIFCDIVAGRIPANVVLDRPDVMAFHDIAPKAPVHVLVIPKKHLSSPLCATEQDEALLGRLILAASDVAKELGLADGGCRFVINSGDDGGQSVAHLHVHVLGGRILRWPPG